VKLKVKKAFREIVVGNRFLHIEKLHFTSLK